MKTYYATQHKVQRNPLDSTLVLATSLLEAAIEFRDRIAPAPVVYVSPNGLDWETVDLGESA